MKAPTLKRRIIAFALLSLTLIALATPIVARHTTASTTEPSKVAVNWNGRMPAPTPTPKR
jgi:hypothetical protein